MKRLNLSVKECKIVLVLLLFSVFLVESKAVGMSGQYQWSVQLRGYISPETGKEPTAYLWLPDNIDTVKAVVMAQQNMTEESLFKMPAFKKEMSRLGIGLLWIAPSFTNTWDPQSGCQKIFEEMMTAIAYQSGHPEIVHAPLIPFGHSAQATFPWNFAAWNNEQTLCIISFHGDAPRTNLCGYGTANVEWGRTRNIDGIPGLMIMGEYEWWDARLIPALAFKMMYPQSCVSSLCDTGRGHFDCSEETASYIAKFIEKSLQYRFQGSYKPLKKLIPEEGWLADRWYPNQTERPKASPYSQYKGDKHDAFWYFDKEMAEITESRYRRDRNLLPQYVGLEYQGKQIPYDANQQGGMLLRLNSNDLKKQNGYPVFTISAISLDSLGCKIKTRGQWNGSVETICGPVEKIGDNLFRIVPYEAGMDNPRRSFTIWLYAIAPNDGIHKFAIQPIQIKIN